MGTAHPPAISVLIAVRNGAAYLDDALASLGRQSFRDFEIVLIDNGSHDDSARIIAEWSRREPRLRAFRVERPGLARSLAYAASMARASIFARLDGDDLAMPARLGMQYALMQQRPSLGLLGSSVEVIDAAGKRIGEKHLPESDAALRQFLASGNPFVHSSIMMRREAYERAGGYRQGLRVCEDFDLWCRIAELTEIAAVDRPLVQYRLHRQAITFRQSTRMALADTCIIAAQHARRIGVPEPFSEGVPTLRSALVLLHVRREDIVHRALKAVTGAARLALQFGDHAGARHIRRRAYRFLVALPFGRATLSGAGHILASHFRRYSS